MSDEPGSVDHGSQLRANSLFRHLDADQLREVAGLGHFRRLAPGERIAQAGSRGIEVYAILKGELKLVARRGDEERVVRLAHTGETVPLAVLVDPPVLITAIEASVETDVIVLPRSGLMELCEADPAIGFRVYRAAARSFEDRYRTTLNEVVHSLRSALHVARAGPPSDRQTS